VNHWYRHCDCRAGRHCEERSDVAIAMTARAAIRVCGTPTWIATSLRSSQ